MVCTVCNKEYMPLACPHCGNALARDGRCPACAVGAQVVCEHCGQVLEIAPVQPAAASAAQPQVPTQDAPRQEQYPFAGQQSPPQPPQYGAPPAGQPAVAQGQYPQYQQYPQGYPGYQPYPYLPAKVPLGGWFAFFYVVSIIGAVFTGIAIFSEFASFMSSAAIGYPYSAFGLINVIVAVAANIATLVLSILLLVNIAKRNIGFKKYYHIRTVLGVAVSIYSIVAMIINPDTAPMLDNVSSYYSVNGTTAMFYLVPSIISLLFSAGIAVAWWVYFDRSRRVAYTCDPVNNPGIL